MKIFSISDLHLPGTENKTMEKFGENWLNHVSKIESHWQEKIAKEDYVLIPGDTSWAMNLEGAYPDFEFLAFLPGKKIFVKGNHDYALGKEERTKLYLKSLDNDISTMRLIHNDGYIIKNNKDSIIGIIGTRGWGINPLSEEKDKKILNRELARLQHSFQFLKSIKVDKIVAMVHFPPTNQITQFFDQSNSKTEENDLNYVEKYDNRFFEYLKSVNVDCIVFGHVHNIKIKNPLEIDGIKIYCTSCDNIDFNPIEINF